MSAHPRCRRLPDPGLRIPMRGYETDSVLRELSRPEVTNPHEGL